MFGFLNAKVKIEGLKIEKDQELHALKILSDLNPVQKYSDYFNKVDILLYQLPIYKINYSSLFYFNPSYCKLSLLCLNYENKCLF